MTPIGSQIQKGGQERTGFLVMPWAKVKGQHLVTKCSQHTLRLQVALSVTTPLLRILQREVRAQLLVARSASCVLCSMWRQPEVLV